MHRRNAKWEVHQRLEEIEQRLYWAGSVGRGDLIDRFGISPQQASADLKTYLALAGDTVSFNGSTRRYEPAEGFTPRIIQGTLDEYETWSGVTGRPFATPRSLCAGSALRSSAASPAPSIRRAPSPSTTTPSPTRMDPPGASPPTPVSGDKNPRNSGEAR